MNPTRAPDLPFGPIALRTEKKYLRIIVRFVANIDTSEYYFGILFS